MPINEEEEEIQQKLNLCDSLSSSRAPNFTFYTCIAFHRHLRNLRLKKRRLLNQRFPQWWRVMYYSISQLLTSSFTVKAPWFRHNFSKLALSASQTLYSFIAPYMWDPHPKQSFYLKYLAFSGIFLVLSKGTDLIIIHLFVSFSIARCINAWVEGIQK